MTLLRTKTVKKWRDGIYLQVPATWLQQNTVTDGDKLQVYDDGPGNLAIKLVRKAEHADAERTAEAASG